jgi:phage terminase large subunit
MVTIPHAGWLPRYHQMPLWGYLRDGGKRAIAIWHRRAGKDEICMHYAAYCAATSTKARNFWHCLPEYNQGRKAIWTAVNPHTGVRRIDEVFPLSWRASTNDNEMFIRLKSGSTWQVVGSDRYDALVGSSAAGVTFSEYALSNPSAWAYLRPMIEENNGWALFITTPRGRNHAKAMYDHAKQTPGWFSEILTARDTEALTPQQLVEALADYEALYGVDVGRAMYQQEYECSFNAAFSVGAFYAHEMAQVREEGRVMEIEPQYDRPVHRAWDIGVHDDTSIWWFQAVGAQLFVLDHYSSSGVGVEHYRDVCAEREAERGWLHGTDWIPHDAKVLEWGAGKTRVEAMQELGLSPMLVPNASLNDGINAVRRVLPLCVFHPRCEVGGINALEQYRREWDDEKKCFRASAVHDWTSHPADSARYMALAYRPPPPRVIKLPPRVGWHIPPPDEEYRGGLRL